MIGHRLRTLVLGSFPGTTSLERGAYYAHPRNRFWPSLAPVIGLPADAAYADRLAALVAAGLGLWDVLIGCDRRGSLDQAIVPGSEVPADLGAIAAAHPELDRIVLNGQSVARLFDRHQLPRALWSECGLRIVVAPSTSPANAARSAREVAGAWRRLLLP